MDAGPSYSMAFYIVMMLVVIFLGLAIIGGGNPLKIFQQASLSATFEPGKLRPIEPQDLSSYIKFDCTGDYRITMEGMGFVYGGKPSTKGGKLEFMVALDYKYLTLAQNEDGSPVKVSCTPNENREDSDCAKPNLLFVLSGLGGEVPRDNETLHFTTWKYNSALAAEIQGTRKSLYTILDNDDFSQFYISSFNANIDVEQACRETYCATVVAYTPTIPPILTESETECKAQNDLGCYWSASWIQWPSPGHCKACPKYTDCRKYTGEQCTQCPVAKAIPCERGALGFGGCQPREI